MTRPLIGITSSVEPARWGDWVREAVLSPAVYARAIERSGGVPVVLPPAAADAASDVVRALDGLILTSGPEIDPSLYGAQPLPDAADPDRRRDRFELALIRAAVDTDTPFLALCRGMHLFNVALGGTLIQDLADAVGHDRHAPDPVKLGAHPVQISLNSPIGRAIGSRADVPTLHHQAVARLGTGLLAVAWADDQIVEGIALQGHPFGIGVQWRPEESEDPRLFQALTTAAARG